MKSLLFKIGVGVSVGINLFMFAILGDAANAYNAIPWQDAFPFMLCLIFLYWVKVKIDTRAGLGKKKLRQLKEVIKEAINETIGLE